MLAEQALILAFARSFALDESPGTSRETLAVIAPHVRSWDHANQLLQVHRLNSVTYAVIRADEIKHSGIFSDDFMRDRRDAYSASFSRVVVEPAVLSRVTSGFQAAGIPAFAIKGLTLGCWLYGDLALREHDDLDVLVPADLGDSADQVMTDLGYASGYRPPLYPGEMPATASYSNPGGGIPVDLSFDPLHVFWQSESERHAAFDRWWSRRQEITIGSRSYSIPGPEDQLIQLSRHAQFHAYFRTNWSLDLLLLLRRFGDTLDWDVVQREASAHGVTAGVAHSLELLRGLFAIELPHGATSWAHVSTLSRRLHERIWPDELALPVLTLSRLHEGTPIAPRFLSPGGVHPMAGLALFAIDRRRSRYFKYLGQRLLPPSSWLQKEYGDGSYPSLLRRHWGAMRDLRRRVRSRRGR